MCEGNTNKHRGEYSLSRTTRAWLSPQAMSTILIELRDSTRVGLRTSALPVDTQVLPPHAYTCSHMSTSE